MNILSVNPYRNINFKSRNEVNVIGYDDDISKERREYIRRHYEYETMPYQSIYEKEPRLDEYQLKNLIDFFAKKPKKIDGDSLFELPLSNVHNISSTRRYNPQIYRGSTLYDAPDNVIEKVKNAGIKTVINLADYGDSYKERIEKAGLKYYDFPIWTVTNYSDEPEQKDKLVGFIKEMQKEYIYMGCEFGTYKTDAAVFLNTLFNPQVKGYCKIYSPEMVDYIPEVADKIYLNMTEDDKKSIGWTPEFEEEFNNKITKYFGW